MKSEEKIRKELKEYIENHIFPIYEKNDVGHGLDHIQYVIKRSLEFSSQFEGVDVEMVYTIAAFHDIAHHIDKDQHEVLSAKMFYENEDMKKFFDEEKRQIIKEAIEDHRASLEYEPRTVYGKIVSSADRNTDINSVLQRTHAYTMKHYPNSSLSEMIQRAYYHITKKFGKDGYAKSYCYDKDFEDFKKKIEDFIQNEYEFATQYMKVNQVMDIKEKAKWFALHAHMGQIRKSEPDKPMIVHPMSVAKILESYGYDDEVVSAGFLHDVVEDTKYTIEDIEKEFGRNIANLVMGASEPNKSLSWEERKRHTIEETKQLPLKNKLVICADKINNLEDLYITFEKNGKRDFKAFKRGEDLQRWYYTSVYESLVDGEDENLPIFVRLKDILDKVFYQKEDLFLKDTIFVEHASYYAKLKQLHAKKMELQRLKDLVTLSKPFVIEFTGTPRTGKTTILNNLYDFFKKGGFEVSLIEEFTTSKYYKENLKSKFSQMDVVERNIAIIEEVSKELDRLISLKKDIILVDRSINDRQIWNDRLFEKGEMKEEQYQKLREYYSKISKQWVDFLVITYADSLVALKRDYTSSLALEQRSFLNQKNIDEFNYALMALQDFFKESVENYTFIDTTNSVLSETSTLVASQILPAMRSKYLNELKLKYHLK